MPQVNCARIFAPTEGPPGPERESAVEEVAQQGQPEDGRQRLGDGGRRAATFAPSTSQFHTVQIGSKKVSIRLWKTASDLVLC
ncbi:hypothetical protein, partial [Nocardioides salarius]|uniref:hypothetical protein n=1 Tax=Nocardioides salarius TaxID=374513 RepID=UPI0030FAE5A4